MKTFIMIFILAASQTAWACKCAMATIDRLSRDPVSAATVFFAQAHVKSDSQFLTTTHSYDSVGKNIDLDSKTSCRVFLKDNVRYLILTSQKDQYHSCSTVFIELTLASEQLKKLLKRQPKQPQSNPAWLTCQADADCRLTKNVCGNEIAINKLYEKEQAAFVKSNELKLRCRPAGKLGKMNAVCDSGLCLAKPDQL